MAMNDRVERVWIIEEKNLLKIWDKKWVNFKRNCWKSVEDTETQTLF